MELKMPHSEIEWQEWLTAYLDEELAADERRAVEAWLEQTPERARQLEELRRVGGVLQAWTVEAPEPDPAFLRQLRTRPAPRRAEGWLETLRRAFLTPWPVGAALFMVGILTGAGGLKMIEAGRPAVQSVAAVHPASDITVAAATETPTPAMSDAQATNLRMECEAATLRDQVLRALDRREYMTAARMYQELRNNYRDSTAMRQLDENPALRGAAQRLGAVKSI